MQSFAAFIRKLLFSETANAAAPRPTPDFRVLTENTSDVIIQVRPDGRCTYASPSCTRLLGWAPEELVGRGPEALVVREHIPEVAADMAAIAAGERKEGMLTLPLRTKSGGAVWVEAKARTISNPQTGEPGDLVVIMRDITERKKREEQMAALAMTDGLTGISNRRAFDKALYREWDRTLRTGGAMSLLLLDIDHFKEFNDTYGHQVGDDCLRLVAATVCRVLQQSTDTIARYGGEEFVVILPDTDLAGAMEVAERLRRAVADANLHHIKNQDGGGRVTVSIGAATALSRVGGTIRMPEGLLLAADSALYKAKHNGRNRAEPALLLAPEASSTAA